MYLRSLITFPVRIWLAGLPSDVAKAIMDMPAAEGLAPVFSVYDEMPETTEKPPACVLFPLAPGRADKARALGDEDTFLIGWRGKKEDSDAEEMAKVDDFWDAPEADMLPHYWKWAQEHIWRRCHAWLIHNWWQTTLNMVPDLMWYKNLAGLHLEVNNALARTVGKTVADCRGQRHGVVWGLKPEEYEEGERVCLESDMRVVQSGKLNIGAEQVLDNGEMRDLKTFKTPVFDKDGNIIGTAGVAQDITLLNRYHKKILDMAHKDELTGLSNRRFFYEYIAEYRKNQAGCIFSVDLDHFKEVNDTYGHKVGDDALKAVSEVLKFSFPTGVVCRFGGDEFLVLFLGSLSNDAAKDMAEVFLARLRERFQSQEQFRRLTGSVGIAISHDMHYPIDELIKESDTALYAAKAAGRDCVRTAWETE
ncbi:MAG: diguanylate cyclase [Schwartzia sp.]|nr:diguanylate cyclase [Schwartzia sp. (in: firmicutes)]